VQDRGEGITRNYRPNSSAFHGDIPQGLSGVFQCLEELPLARAQFACVLDFNQAIFVLDQPSELEPEHLAVNIR
jgi:hypothetical protein